jgi:hypothetical protein
MAGATTITNGKVVGDRVYSSRKIRTYLRRRGSGVVTPRKKTERRKRFDRDANREWSAVEWMIG